MGKIDWRRSRQTSTEPEPRKKIIQSKSGKKRRVHPHICTSEAGAATTACTAKRRNPAPTESGCTATQALSPNTQTDSTLSGYESKTGYLNQDRRAGSSPSGQG
jgi:hypothetical protein